ncbi:DNA/RNA non-specific endonuclease [Yersinia enterocolitica]|nr:DNA/RNA non-specific endonuclease [Yersinia enterocolitica]
MKFNLIKLLPVLLLTACTTTDHSSAPKTILSAPTVTEQNLPAAAIDNCLVGCPTGG